MTSRRLNILFVCRAGAQWRPRDKIEFLCWAAPRGDRSTLAFYVRRGLVGDSKLSLSPVFSPDVVIFKSK